MRAIGNKTRLQNKKPCIFPRTSIQEIDPIHTSTDIVHGRIHIQANRNSAYTQCDDSTCTLVLNMYDLLFGFLDLNGAQKSMADEEIESKRTLGIDGDTCPKITGSYPIDRSTITTLGERLETSLSRRLKTLSGIARFRDLSPRHKRAKLLQLVESSDEMFCTEMFLAFAKSPTISKDHQEQCIALFSSLIPTKSAWRSRVICRFYPTAGITY
jgi:hypothetical protein